jgi:hypothetical protein
VEYVHIVHLSMVLLQQANGLELGMRPRGRRRGPGWVYHETAQYGPLVHGRILTIITNTIAISITTKLQLDSNIGVE